MAKKQTKAAVKETVVEQGFIEVVEQPVTVTQTATTPRVNSIEKSKNTWEIKDRLYHLKGKTPLSSLMKASNVYYFDEEKGHERELKNTSNQRTCFVDEMVGDQRLEHIIFRNGNLVVPKNKVVLQQLLSLYHPMKDILI